jgi:hypothetical protein
MLPGNLKLWWGNLPQNEPLGVAQALLLPIIDETLNGRSLWVSGNKITELEKEINETQPLWMGRELSAAVNQGQMRLLEGGIDQ